MSTRNDASELVLAAARNCLIRSGGRKVTMAEVAREAGVSRPTVYRRWTDVAELVRGLLTRELRGLLTSTTGPEGLIADDLDTMVDRMVAVVAAVRDDDLVIALWREQREFMLPYAFDRLGESQRGLRDHLVDALIVGQRRGIVRDGDPGHLASMVLLTAQTIIQSRGLVEEILGDAWRTEFRKSVLAYLRPVETAAPLEPRS